MSTDLLFLYCWCNILTKRMRMTRKYLSSELSKRKNKCERERSYMTKHSIHFYRDDEDENENEEDDYYNDSSQKIGVWGWDKNPFDLFSMEDQELIWTKFFIEEKYPFSQFQDHFHPYNKQISFYSSFFQVYQLISSFP